MIGSILGCSFVSAGTAQGPAASPGTQSSLNGKIAQLNYNRDAEVSGFLLDKNTLIEFPPRAAAVLAGSLHQGDSVRIDGFVETAPSGFRTVHARSFRDQTSGRDFSETQPGAAAPYSGTRRIKQLNYGPDGAVNAFLLDNGTMANVAPLGADNPSAVQAGATVTIAGFARTTGTGRTIVDVQSLTANGQTIAMNRSAGLPSPPAPPRRPRMRRGAAPPPPPDAPEAPAPAGRINQPPPPPPPPAQ